MQSLDYIVVGGGIVGLAIAATLRPFGSVAVLERHPRLIHETSSRNSGVVHAGVYYPADSLKTRLCMAGNANLWRWQQQCPTKVRAKRTGKWIGTCEEGATAEESALQALIDNMQSRGVAYELVSRATQRQEEPLVRMGVVVKSTNTGIVDVASLRDAFEEIIEASPSAAKGESCPEDAQGFLCPSAEVTRIDLMSRAQPPTLTVTVRQRNSTLEEPYELSARKAVICAVGLHANDLWARLFIDRTHPVTQPSTHRLHFCKGRYTRYTGVSPPVSRLVYPCPLPQLVGLGVHSTVDLSGAVRFGPDALYTDSPEDYTLSAPGALADGVGELDAFVESQYQAVRRYIPSIEKCKMVPDFVGIRPKLAGPGEAFRDFCFEEVADVEIEGTGDVSAVRPIMKALTGSPAGPSTRPRLIMATGIESPGLTSCTAIGEYVARSLMPDEEQFATGLPPWLHS